MQERPNYYILLELDPSVDDWAVIEQRIQEKRREWSSQKTMGSLTSQRKAENSLKMIREIEGTLKDPEFRKQEAKEARRQRDADKKSDFEKLVELIEVLKVNGQCTSDQVEKLAKGLPSLSKKEVEDRIRQAGITVTGTANGSGSGNKKKEIIDQVTVGSIKRNLVHLKKSNLYDFLERHQKSSPASLHKRADEINKEILRLGKTDTDSSAQKELAGLCLSIFGSDKEKEKYDNWLAIEAMEQLKPHIDTAGLDRFISSEELQILVKKALERGVEKSDALTFIKDYAQARNWGVQETGKLQLEEFKQCRYCYTLNNPSSARCSSCGEDLSLACPQCGTVIPAHNPACSSCGCYPGDASVVKALLKEAQRLASHGDMLGAIDRITLAKGYWPKWKPLLDEEHKIEASQKEREAELQSIESLANSRRLLEAKSALERFLRLRGAAGVDGLKERIEVNLAKAQTLFVEAERRLKFGSLDDAIEGYENVLAVCDDFTPARQALASCPPPPPSSLQVQTTAGGVRLSWREAKVRGSISYKVLRKAHGFPSGEQDGVVVGQVSAPQIDDLGAESGTAWFYSVYTVRGSITSRTPAASGPHLVTAEIKNLIARASDREVVLSWDAPKGCSRVEVWRKSGNAPTGPGNDIRVPVSGNGAHDTGLVNGTTYGYLVVAVFDDAQTPGKEIHMPGVRSITSPVSPPEPVTDLSGVREGKVILFHWTPIAKATVQIRETTTPPSAQAGLIIPIEHADRFGRLVATSSTGGAQADLKTQGRIYFVPLTIIANTAVLGQAVVITTVEDVTHLKAQAVGKNIVLTWEWPAGIEEVIVCYAHDQHPADPINSHSTRVRVTRQEYLRNNFWDLRGVVKQPHYFTLFAKPSSSDAYSSGVRIVETMGQSVSVNYRVVLKRAVFSRAIQDAWVELQCCERASLPGILVIGKQKNVPISSNDGTLIADVPEVFFQNGKARITIPKQNCNRSTYVKLFFKSPSLAQEIRLLPAPKEELALG